MTTDQPPAEDAPSLPLAGLRVIDISNVFSLPYAGGLLADLGAEVIKIEGPARLDVSRGGAISPGSIRTTRSARTRGTAPARSTC